MTKRNATPILGAAAFKAGDDTRVELASTSPGIPDVPKAFKLFGAGRNEARDGRFFINDNPQAVIAAFKADGGMIPIDLDHEMERTNAGPAQGWINALEDRNGELWASEIEWAGLMWLDSGEPKPWAVIAKEYRFISPAFLVDEEQRVIRMTSVALTNKPALRLPKLASLDPNHIDPTHMEECSVDPKKLRLALGLPETATDDEVLAKSTQLASVQTAATPVAGMVPVADLQLANTQLAAANAELASIKKKQADEEADALVTSAIAAGKAAPSSKEFWLNMCSNGGIAAVRTHFETAPKIAAAAEPAKAATGADGKLQLTSVQKTAAKQLGISEAEFAKQLAEDAKEAE